MKQTNNLFFDSLREQGIRLTPVRQQLLTSFLNDPVPLTARDLAFQCQGVGLTPNKSTVYRELGFLCHRGIVRDLDFGDGKKRYELAALGHHHHLVCRSCSKVEDVRVCDSILEHARKIMAEKQFIITDHTLEFFGQCALCQELA